MNDIEEENADIAGVTSRLSDEESDHFSSQKVDKSNRQGYNIPKTSMPPLPLFNLPSRRKLIWLSAVAAMITFTLTVNSNTCKGQGLDPSQLQVAKDIRFADLDSSSNMIRRIIVAARAEGNDSILAESYFLLGLNQQAKGNYTESTESLSLALESYYTKWKPRMLSTIYGRIGKNYAETGDYESAIEHYLVADSIAEDYLIEYVILEPKLLLGELYEYMLKPERANEYYREAYEIASAHNVTFLKILALYYLLDLNLIRMGKSGFEDELNEYLDLIKGTTDDGLINFQHAHLLFSKVNETEKINFLQNQYDKGPEKTTLFNWYFICSELAKNYNIKNQTERAITLIESEMPYFLQQNNIACILSLKQLLSELYEANGQYMNALGQTKDFLKIREKYHSERISKYVDSLEVVHQTALKDNQLAAQELALTRQSQQRNILLVALISTVWVGTFITLFLYNRNKLIKKIGIRENELHLNKIHQLEQEKKMLAMSSMIEGQEEERKRIARDLHDGLGGLLSSVKAQLNIIQLQVSKLESMDVYKRANNLIDNASVELRRIAYNMMPSSLSRLGLREAMEDMTVTIERDHGIIVDLQIMGDTTRLEETKEIMIYRIFQELCNNVIKHAKADKLLIQFNKTESEIFLIVEDNGKGFNLADLKDQNGIGMKSLKSRVRYLNGDMDVNSSPGEGTCVTVHIPIEPEM